MRYQLEYGRELCFLTFHTDKHLTNQAKVFFEAGEECEEAEDYNEEMPLFVKDILSIYGVVGVILSRYELTVEKGIVFEWDEITERVMFILKIYFTNSGKIIKIGSPIKHPFDEEGTLHEMT